MEVKPWFQDPEKVSLSPDQRCPFNKGNKYKDYVNIFLGQNFMSPEYRFPKGEVPLYTMFFKVLQQVSRVFCSGSALASPVMVATPDQLVPVTVGSQWYLL